MLLQLLRINHRRPHRLSEFFINRRDIARLQQGLKHQVTEANDQGLCRTVD